METRQVTEYKVWVLRLNPMTANAEAGNVVGVAYDKEQLMDFYNNEFAKENYRDGQFHKVFKKNGSLEWYNPVFNIDGDGLDHFGHGIYSEWISEHTLDNVRHLLIS